MLGLHRITRGFCNGGPLCHIPMKNSRPKKKNLRFSRITELQRQGFSATRLGLPTYLRGPRCGSGILYDMPAGTRAPIKPGEWTFLPLLLLGNNWPQRPPPIQKQCPMGYAYLILTSLKKSLDFFCLYSFGCIFGKMCANRAGPGPQ